MLDLKNKLMSILSILRYWFYLSGSGKRNGSLLWIKGDRVIGDL